MKTRILLSVLILAGLALLMPRPVQGGMLTFSPQDTVVTHQANFDIDIVYSPGSYLGAFDFTVLFPSAIASLTGLDFGTALGDAGLAEAMLAYSLNGGTIGLYGVSFLLPAEVAARQAAPFVLATMHFQSVQPGWGEIRFGPAENYTQWVFSDEMANDVSAGMSATNGTITVLRKEGIDIPEPVTGLLIGVGALALGLLGRR